MIDQNSLAAANAWSVQNVQFENIGQLLQRKIVIIGTYDPAKLDIVDNVPERFLSPEAVGAKYGFGSMLHRLAIKTFKGSGGVETWVVPQPEDVAAVVATGKFDFGGAATEAGTFDVFISGEFYARVTVANGDTNSDVAAKVVAALNAADLSIPVTQVVNGVNTFEVDFTAKTKGPWGNSIDLSINLDGGELPAGLTLAVTGMAAGLNNPDIQAALDALGVDDNQNEKNFTALVHGYGQDSTALDAISTYNGEGNLFTGNYAKTVARPFRSLFGDVATGEAGLTALIAVSDADKLDRTNGVIPAPGSENHPEEIAALLMGIMESTNSTRAEEHYIDVELPGIRVGSDRWTDKYDNRDLAVKSGISTTLVKNGVLTAQNVVSFYRPDTVPQESNGYRSMRNISIIQNLLFNQKNAFEQDKWKGVTVVADVTKVSNTTSRQKARDRDSVLDQLLELAEVYEGLAWIFSASFTIDKLKEANRVVIRPAGNGFDISFPVVLSGEAGIFNGVIEFDTSLAVFL